MKYRVEIDIAFDLENEVIAFLNLIEEIKNKVYKPLGTEEIPNYRKCRYHKCFHDEASPKPCGNYVNIDFDKIIKNHKTEAGLVIKSTPFKAEEKVEEITGE